jgi:ADP-ribosylglycohydrolase
VKSAVELWNIDYGKGATPERIENLGGGWIAEEALAIGVYCALAAGKNYPRGILLAINHGGDSDSTGSITGNLLGAMLGTAVIPAEWLSQLELREEITRVADDLASGYFDTSEWFSRYPGW